MKTSSDTRYTNATKEIEKLVRTWVAEHPVAWQLAWCDVCDSPVVWTGSTFIHTSRDSDTEDHDVVVKS